MAKLSAYTAFKNGVSKKSFVNGYFIPAKRLLVRDNIYGIMMLKINDYMSSQRQIANSHVNLMKSNKDKKTADRINEILWNMFTGNVPYKEIFFKAINPGFVSKTLPVNIFAWVRQKKDDFNAWLKRN
jgi:hypothetical protein